MSDSLDNAPSHVKLAVDLIMILEQNNIQPSEALDALKIVESDFQQKVQAQCLSDLIKVK